MNDDTVETVVCGDFTIKIMYDRDPADPRKECDNFSHMYCCHRRYTLGDEQSREPLTADELRERAAEAGDEILAILPLYLYDHSGITISCSSFADRFDSGQVGWAYITAKQMQRMGVEGNQEALESIIRSEVETYDQFLTGQVYGYVVETQDGDEVDSCWGFYGGLDYVRSEATSVAMNAKHPHHTKSKQDAACVP